MSYVRESDIRVKSYDNSNFSWASVVQFRVSRYIMSANRTSLWKVMTIPISRVLSLCNFEHLDILRPKFGHPCEKLWPFEFSRASVVQFRASRWVMSVNQTSVWKVMIIRISRELPLFYFECIDILCSPIQTSVWKVMTIWILESFRCSISSV